MKKNLLKKIFGISFFITVFIIFGQNFTPSRKSECTEVKLKSTPFAWGSWNRKLQRNNQYLVRCPYDSGYGSIYATNESGPCTYTAFFNNGYNFVCNGTAAGIKTVTCNVSPGLTCERHDSFKVSVADDIEPLNISDPKPYGSCDSGSDCVAQGGVTYFGGHFHKSESTEPGYHGLDQIINNISPFKIGMRTHFRDIRRTFHAKMIRIPIFSNNGTVTYPIPNQTQLKNLNEIIDIAFEEGLRVYLLINPVFDIVENYTPDTIDTFFLKNGKTVWQNHLTFFNTLVSSIGVERFKLKINYVDCLGDFNPFRGTLIQQGNRQKWWKNIWSNLALNYQNLIPQIKKTFEINGNASNPMDEQIGLPAQIKWVKNQLQRNGWPQPAKYGIETYTERQWVVKEFGGNWDKAFQAQIDYSAAAIGGSDPYNRLLVVEAGVSRPSHPNEKNAYGQDVHGTDDGQNGQESYTSLLRTVSSRSSGIPVVLFTYFDGPWLGDGRWGLRNSDNSLAKAAWVIPQYFAY